jgi:ATP-dependent Zn protease
MDPKSRPRRPVGLIVLLVASTLAGVFTWGILTLDGVAWYWAIISGYLTIAVVRGFHSWAQRKFVQRELISDYNDPKIRNTEIARANFWRVIFRLVVLASIILGLIALANLLNLPPGFATAVLTGLQVLGLFLFNFLFLFGPFILYGAIGREVVQPGDANFQVAMSDVRGQKSAVAEITQILELMQQGRAYVAAGGKRERGVLMVGPPGTGKTMLAKAMASSLEVPIIVTSGAAFQGMFFGMDILNVFMLVRKAKQVARLRGGCVVFIDEFDALGSRRSGMGGGGLGVGGMFGGGMMGLNMLLVQMDGVDRAPFVKKQLRRLLNGILDGLYFPRIVGFNGTRVQLRVPNLKPPNFNILFVGATNRPSVLDEAVTRPGRFGRQIFFRLPTRDGRKDIADLYFSRKRHDPQLDSPARREEFARVTEGYSPADIEQALSVALMYAFQKGRDYFDWYDLRESMSNIEGGLAIPVEYSERDKVAIARHELGHAVAATFYTPENAHGRLSIKMRARGALAFHRAVPIEEEFIKFRSQHAGHLRHFLGAIAAERVFYGENSSGVSGDLMTSTVDTCVMVGVVGMGPDPLSSEMSRRAIDFGEALISVAEITQGIQEQGTVVGAVLSNPKSRRVVAQVMGSAYIDCWRLMYVNREAIDQAAEALIAQLELMGDEITGLLDSVGLRMPVESDPYPPELPALPADDEARPKLAIEKSA